MSSPQGTRWNWLRNGDEAFPGMLTAIDAAQRTVCLETYIYAASALGVRFLDALVRAAQRGVRVRVLVDALGSVELPDSFWSPLRAVGGEAKFFNPIAFKRIGIRNHRKLLVCDDAVAFVGGFNIAPEYEGDGVARGWCDLGIRLEGPLAIELAASFHAMFKLADFRHKRFVRLRRAALQGNVTSPDEHLLLGRPGFGRNPIRRALGADLRHAQNAQIMVAYFLSPRRIPGQLRRASLRGGAVQLILPGKSDVTLSQLAARSQYQRLMKAGVEIYEYQPQILHAKLFVLNDAVYVGSSNLDPRSLGINYELMIRFENPQMAAEAREIITGALRLCRRVDPTEWRESRTFWTRFKERWAYFLLARIDPYVARKQWRALPD
jgi:cardiolipin synthase A/B